MNRMRTIVTTTPVLRGSFTESTDASVLLDAKIASHNGSRSRVSRPNNNNATKRRRRPSFTIPEKHAKSIEYMISQLTPDELEVANRTDYLYLKESAMGGGSPKEGDDEGARLMALRYLKSKKDPELALQKMRSTLEFRQEIDIDGLRLAFEDPFSDYSEPLEKFLNTGKNFVQGYDKSGRATHVFVPRNTREHDAEWTLKESLYTMERAMACSRHPDMSVNCILDFRGFSAVKHSPPVTLGKDFLLTLRSHYAGQVHKIFILDAPSGFALLWKIFQPFLGKATQEKIVFVSGKKQKEKVLSQYYDPDQATKWMLPQTGKMVERPLDTQEYCWKTPFDNAFNE